MSFTSTQPANVLEQKLGLWLSRTREKDRSTVPRPFSIFIGGFVRKDSVDAKVIELSLRILVITADPDVSDASTFAGHETAFCVRKV